MYRLIVHKKVVKFLNSRSKSEQRRLMSKIDLLKQNPFDNSKLDIKKMKGDDNLFRLRVGQFRIIYEVRQDELVVLVMTAASRGDVYKRK